jgi:hypothetical protein
LETDIWPNFKWSEIVVFFFIGFVQKDCSLPIEGLVGRFDRCALKRRKEYSEINWLINKLKKEVKQGFKKYCLAHRGQLKHVFFMAKKERNGKQAESS